MKQLQASDAGKDQQDANNLDNIHWFLEKYKAKNDRSDSPDSCPNRICR